MCCLLVYAHLHKGNISVYMQRQSSKECREMHRVRVIFPSKVYWSVCVLYVDQVTADIDMVGGRMCTHVKHVSGFSQKYKYINCWEGADKKKNLLIKYKKSKHT